MLIKNIFYCPFLEIVASPNEITNRGFLFSMNHIEFILKDERNSRSKNLKSFFKQPKNKHLNEVIVFEGELWFVSIGFKKEKGGDNGFAGCKVKSAACLGGKTRTYYPSWQNDNYKIVTSEFYKKYIENGILAFPEIWGEIKFDYKPHQEFSTI